MRYRKGDRVQCTGCTEIFGHPVVGTVVKRPDHHGNPLVEWDPKPDDHHAEPRMERADTEGLIITWKKPTFLDRLRGRQTSSPNSSN